MSNLIDRQAAIDALKEHRALYCDNTPETFSKLSYAEKSRVDELDTAIATLVNLPSAQPEQRWIPVSERLPDEYEYVLLCDIEPDEDTGYSRIAVGWLQNGRICCWDDRATREDFVAWMPLPEPYKEGE